MAELRVRIAADEIARRVAALGAEMTRDYRGEAPLVLVGVLKGSFVFLADLARAIGRPVRIDFVGLASYGASTESSGEVRLTKPLGASIAGADVVVVEDIIDTGLTMSHLKKLLETHQPRSLRVAALLDKPSRRTCELTADYVGFAIPDEFVVGYGLDYDEQYRNLADICVLTL